MKKMKRTSSSTVCKNIYHNGGYLMLFVKRKLQSFNSSGE